MSNKASAWAWDQEGLTTTEKFTLVALADNADEEGVCWPGLRFLSKKTGLSRVTVRKSMAGLQAKDKLSVTPQKRHDGSHSSNMYQLDPGGTVLTQGGSIQTVGGSAALPQEPPLKRHLTNPKRVTVIDDAFRTAMREKYPRLTDVDDRIEEALAHTAARKWTDLQRYVGGWLRRDAERIATGTNGRSSTTRPTARQPEDFVPWDTAE